VSTLVSFHAHPDDESIATGGVIAKAASEGHRVVLVFATRGEVGEVADGFLSDGETLSERRVVETEASARELGAQRVEFLGYRDSGMVGEPTNDDPECFWQAEVDAAAERLAAIVRDEAADVLTIYDSNGTYGHPDHIQVHRVGKRAGELVGGDLVVYEATSSRDHFKRLMVQAADAGMEVGEGLPDMESFGSPDVEITTVVDVREFIDVKKASMRAHASQIDEQSFFLQMPDEVFKESFGWEFFIRHGVPSTTAEDQLAL
jgi:LmbE family N-acetylglucosaminyl deacetylase